MIQIQTILWKNLITSDREQNASALCNYRTGASKLAVDMAAWTREQTK